jgi:hypothetical protein
MSKNPHAVALGRLGGQAKSQKKTEAVRKNGVIGAYVKKQKKALDKANQTA